jgi:phytoene/squalene synthetase
MTTPLKAASGFYSQPEDLFHATSRQCSRLVTHRYSTSFTLGIRLLNRRFHDPIYAIYGFVRFADEIVDSFQGHNAVVLLEAFERDTWLALEEGISLNPILDSFQWVVRKYGIDPDLIVAFLASMKMDLGKKAYSKEDYSTYIYGSAESVGLMCLKVFCEGDEARYQSLSMQACSLGSAFQKVNFLRDMQSDYADRGRVYFPEANLDCFDSDTKSCIEKDIEHDFTEALKGITHLPMGARLGVYVAYRYYYQLFRKIKQTAPAKIMRKRIRVPDPQKVLILAGSYFRHQLNML